MKEQDGDSSSVPCVSKKHHIVHKNVEITRMTRSAESHRAFTLPRDGHSHPGAGVHMYLEQYAETYYMYRGVEEAQEGLSEGRRKEKDRRAGRRQKFEQVLGFVPCIEGRVMTSRGDGDERKHDMDMYEIRGKLSQI